MRTIVIDKESLEDNFLNDTNHVSKSDFPTILTALFGTAGAKNFTDLRSMKKIERADYSIVPNNNVAVFYDDDNKIYMWMNEPDYLAFMSFLNETRSYKFKFWYTAGTFHPLGAGTGLREGMVSAANENGYILSFSNTRND